MKIFPVVVKKVLGSSGPTGFTDAISLQIIVGDSNAVPTDAATFQLALLTGDTNAAQSDALQLQIDGLGDDNAPPTDTQSFTLRAWLSASAGTDVTSPANANGPNDGVLATVSTGVLASNPETMTSELGSNLPSGLTLTSVIYRGWFRAQTTLVTSTAAVIAHSSSALFADVVMFTQSSLGGDTNHLGGTFTFDMIAAGINTQAKLQSLQIYHRCTDLAAGVTPAVLTVDAGCLEIAGAFTAASNQLYINDAVVNENDGTVTVTIIRGSPDGTTTSVNYATTDRTTAIAGDNAIVGAGNDYTATSGSVSFTGMETSKTFTVPIIDISYPEPDRQFVVNLSSPTNGTIVDGAATVTIQDDEAAKTFLQDFSGNGKDLTAGSTATTDVTCPTAKFGHGREWTAVANQTLLRTDDAFDLTGSIAATLVFEIDALPSILVRPTLFSFTSSDSSSGPWGIHYSNTGATQDIILSQTGATPGSYDTNVPLTVGYHTLTYRRDDAAKTVVVKLDGAEILNSTYTGSPTSNAGGNLTLFGVGTGAAATPDGKCYDARVYNTAIAQATLDAIVASSGKCKPEGTELAWYRLEDT